MESRFLLFYRFEIARIGNRKIDGKMYIYRGIDRYLECRLREEQKPIDQPTKQAQRLPGIEWNPMKRNHRQIRIQKNKVKKKGSADSTRIRENKNRLVSSHFQYELQESSSSNLNFSIRMLGIRIFIVFVSVHLYYHILLASACDQFNHWD